MAAQDAELKLKVSLDLAFFRQQLNGLGAVAAGTPMPIQVKFDRRAIQKELANLRQAIGRGTYRIEIGGNIDSLPKKIENLREGLRKLKGEKVELDVGANVGSVSQKEARKIRRELREGIVSRGGKILVPATITPAITNADVTAFKRAVTDKLSGITVKVKAELESASVAGGAKTREQINADVAKGLEEIARMGAERMSGGGVTEAARREQLRTAISGVGITEAKRIAKELGVGGASKYRAGNVSELIDKIVADASIEAVKRYLDPQAMMRNPDRSGLNKVLDTFARGLFQMLGMDPATIRREMAQRRALPGVNFPATVPPRNIPIGPSGTGRALPAGAAAAGLIGGARPPVGLLPAMSVQSQVKAVVDALVAQQGPRALPSGGGQLVDTKRIYAALRKNLDEILQRQFAVIDTEVRETSSGIKDAMGAFAYLVQALKDAEARTKNARIDDAVSSLMREIEGAIKLAQSRARIIPTQVTDLGATQRMLQGQRIAGLLPAAVGRAPSTYATGTIGGETRAEMMARREREARMRSALRGIDVMAEGGAAGRPPAPYSQAYRSARSLGAIVPYAAGGAIVPQPSMAGGGATPPGGGGGRFGGLGGAMVPGAGDFGRAIGGVKLPGTGTIKELGSEFAFATKQVVLFGQAYKLLAFIQDLPAQVGAAVSQLQSFRNTLNAVTPSTEEARASNELLLDLMEKYNVPLQSARDGFTKLYASMAPAGFSGNEIRDLFTGITKAAATFGMSADKVDRVNYAFAQMASKGQIMSEELKGQLGDVLPGAMALFAEAAGFEGPKAIQDFSAALEDGAYKGEAMVALLKNVTVVMNKEFGPGAEGAARTFQGVMNHMQNSMTLLYESFEPVAVGFLNSVVVPMTDGIKQLTDGLNAFFTGSAAKTAGGFAIAQELERLRPAFDGIGQNVATFAVQLGQLARVALDVSKVFLQIAGNPIVGYLAKLYAIALPINIALGVMRGLWASNALQLVIFNARVASGTTTLSAFRGMMAATGATAQATAASIRTAGITLRTFFATTGVGLVVVGISMLIEKFLTMNQALADTKAKAMGAAQAIRSMSQTEARAAEQQAAKDVKLLQQLSQQKSQGGVLGDKFFATTPEQKAALERAGVSTKQIALKGGGVGPGVETYKLAGAIQSRQASMREAEYRQRQIKSEEAQMKAPAVLNAIPPSEGDGKAKKGKELDQYNKSQLQFIQDQFDIEKQRLDKQLQGQLISQTQYDISLAELELESSKLEIAERYRLEVEKTNKDNLSTADKALKLKDLEINKNNALIIAEDKRNLAIGAARQKIIKPIIEEIDKETLGIQRQALQMEGLKQGRLELTSAQEAELMVKERYADLATDERDIAQGELDLLKQIIAQRLENVKLLEKQTALTSAQRGLETIGTGLRAGFTGGAASVFEQAMQQYGDRDYATQLANIETAAMQLRSVFEGLQGAIQGVSGAFANVLTEGVANMISGTATAKEVFANFLQSVGQALSQAASQMIATYIAIGIAKLFAGFGGGGQSNIVQGIDVPVAQMPTGMAFANGGIAPGGFQAFANGGVVSGPTLGLIGEGRYNEAIVPLPDGKSIPVQLGGRSARDLMGGNAPGMPAQMALNMKFESTKINGVEYVSREQLEQAMAETRRASIAGGAQRGMSMTLDKIQQSPSTRSRIGMR